MKKILVIDDEIDICNMLKEYLQMEDYLVYTAADANEALKQVCNQPDLILLDGGKGHVSAIKPLLETFGEEISLFGIVKDGFHRTRGIMDENHELLLERNSELFNFFACMQDEVHRYAIQAHRKKHESSNIRSSLEKIPGVGPAVRKKLLSHFKSVKAIKEASFDELKTVVSQKTAQNIVDYFKN